MGVENGKRKGDFYTKDWKKLSFYKGVPNFENEIKKPSKLNEIISITEKLSNSFIYVRVDLYFFDEKIYFGELTFTPAGGLSKFSNKKYDFKMGSLLELDKDVLTQ